MTPPRSARRVRAKLGLCSGAVTVIRPVCGVGDLGSANCSARRWPTATGGTNVYHSERTKTDSGSWKCDLEQNTWGCASKAMGIVVQANGVLKIPNVRSVHECGVWDVDITECSDRSACEHCQVHLTPSPAFVGT